MPLILGTNSIKDTGYDVANSLRLNGGDNCRLSRTSPNTAPTNADKFTISFWIKRSSEDAGSGFEHQQVFTTYNNTDTTNFQEFQIYFTQNTLKVQTYYSSNQMSLVTSRVFRDTNSWYSIIFIYDSSQGTASNRQKLYINGVQETSFSTETYSGQNVDGEFAIQNHPQIIGTRLNDDLDPDYYLAEFIGVDGQALAHTDFGEFDEDSGIWKPKDISGIDVGNLGFYLDFENSSALGTDVSGVGNFTLTNLDATDQSTDTCTNNFATFNPLITTQSNSLPVFSEGNLTSTFDNGSTNEFALSTFAVSSGKWYAEFKWVDATGGGTTSVGIVRTDANFNQDVNDNGISYKGNGQKNINGSSSSYGASFGTDNIISIALNMDDNEVTFYKDGASQGTISITANLTYFMYCSDYNNKSADANFGSPETSVSSGNTDGNGYGNFEYAVPSGYFALNTKNLAEYG